MASVDVCNKPRYDGPGLECYHLESYAVKAEAQEQRFKQSGNESSIPKRWTIEDQVCDQEGLRAAFHVSRIVGKSTG